MEPYPLVVPETQPVYLGIEFSIQSRNTRPLEIKVGYHPPDFSWKPHQYQTGYWNHHLCWLGVHLLIGYRSTP